MNIAFCINRLGMEGLGATLSSLIKHCRNSACLDLYFLCSELPAEEKKDIEKLLEILRFEGTIQFIDFHAQKEFGHLQSLHGDWTAYGVLLIPQLIKEEKVLYLDSDLLVLLDILELDELDPGDFALSAVYGTAAELSRDKEFYLRTLSFSSELTIFNSGVLQFNRSAWKEQEIDQKCEHITKCYPKHLLSADQTLLNAVFAGNYAAFPKRYNRRWTVMDKEVEDPSNAIWHFVGSPKPWDLLGKETHKGHRLWASYNPDFWSRKYHKVSADKVYRTWQIKKSIIRAFIKEYLR